MTRTLIPTEQDTLWDLTPSAPTVPAQAPAPLKKPRRFHRLSLPAPLRGVCNPRCLVCGRDENTGLCAPCPVVCHQPGPSTRVEICLITRRITAHPAGPRLLATTCPWCSQTHWHSSTSTTPYRISGCGQPYVVTIPRPRINPRTGLTTPAQPPNLSKAAT